MDADTASTLRRLLATQPVASLATLHRGEPAISMVPFVLPPGAAHFVIHVSALGTHTADMLAHPRVGLLVVADVGIGVLPGALPRVSMQADAEQLPVDGEQHPRRGHSTPRGFPTPRSRSNWPTSRSFC